MQNTGWNIDGVFVSRGASTGLGTITGIGFFLVLAIGSVSGCNPVCCTFSESNSYSSSIGKLEITVASDGSLLLGIARTMGVGLLEQG